MAVLPLKTNGAAASTGDIATTISELRDRIVVAAAGERIATAEWDFIKPGDEAGFTNFAGNASTASGVRVGGVREITSNASANHENDSYINVPFFSGSAGTRTHEVAWGLSYRARLTGTVDAGTEAYVGFGQAPGQIWLGVHGTTSTTKYVLQVNQGTTSPITLSSDVSIDADWHQFDLAYDLTNFWTRVDSGTWRAQAITGLYSDYAYLWRRCRSGTAATVRTLELDWIAYVTEGL